MIITSGQIPVAPKTGTLSDNVSAQAHASLENVKATVEASGLKVGDILVFLMCHMRTRYRRHQALSGFFSLNLMPSCQDWR